MLSHLGWPLLKKKRDRSRDGERELDIQTANRASWMLNNLAAFSPDPAQQALARAIASHLRSMVKRWERNA